MMNRLYRRRQTTGLLNTHKTASGLSHRTSICSNSMLLLLSLLLVRVSVNRVAEPDAV